MHRSGFDILYRRLVTCLGVFNSPSPNNKRRPCSTSARTRPDKPDQPNEATTNRSIRFNAQEQLEFAQVFFSPAGIPSEDSFMNGVTRLHPQSQLQPYLLHAPSINDRSIKRSCFSQPRSSFQKRIEQQSQYSAKEDIRYVHNHRPFLTLKPLVANLNPKTNQTPRLVQSIPS